MSNLIKGSMTCQADKLIIDANQVDISERIAAAELLRGLAIKEESLEEEPQEFVEGLTTSEVSVEEWNVATEQEQEAAAIINEAYDEAAQLRAVAENQIEQLKQQAIEEGKELGYSQGMDIASHEIEEKKQALQQEYEAKIHKCEEKWSQSITELEPGFVDVICELIPAITNVSVQGQKDVILYLIDQAMRNIENSHRFLVMVSSEDYPYVSKNQEKIYGFLNPNVTIEIMEDAKLQKNECYIDTDNGIVDAGLSTSISQLIKSLQLLSPK